MNDIDINVRDVFGNTPLLWASRHENVDNVKTILSNRYVDVNARNENGDTALSKAISKKNEQITKLLLDTKK